jgi:2-succinyl-5-enolpyruvyl-6-hydroxy-3-cyclohexene-1-carboxylate synthase
VLIIGHDNAGYTDDEVNSFAGKLKWPVIAENPLSFPQAHPHAVLYLSDPKIRQALAPENMIVIGRTTLSRSVNEFIKLAKNLIVIDPRVADIDNNRQADLLLKSLPSEVISEFTNDGIWQKASELAAAETKNLVWSEQTAIKSICESLTSMSALFVGSSRPVRDIEAFTKFQSGILVFANRGLAGIDGNVSTVFGIAQEHETTNSIMGDLTFLHDISALTNTPKENLRIFVIDNNGGGIFSTLPQAGSNGFEQVFGTPHNLDLVKVISGFGVSVGRVSDLTGLELILRKPVNGFEVVVIEVPSREVNAQILKEITQRVSNAVRIGINLA